MTHYDTLGVSQDASATELKGAYRRLVKVYHPDVNPSPEARIKIRQLTEAYDVLSDYYTRNLYDLELTDPQAYYTYTHPASEEESEEIRAWRAFRQRKAKEQREKIDQLIELKIKFYRFQRLYSQGFVLLAILFSIDYYYWPESELMQVTRVQQSGRDTKVYTNKFQFATDGELYALHQKSTLQEVTIYYSSIFDMPVRVAISPDRGSLSWKINGTLHVFNNVFSYIILVISLVIIGKRQYEDWALTLAIIPFFLSLFLVLFVVTA